MAEKRGASFFAITLNVITCGLGAGVLTMPWGMAGASILMWPVLVIAINAINFWTLMIIIEATEEWQAFDLGSLLGHLPGALGRRAAFTCNAVVLLTRLLSLTGYIIIAVDGITAVAPEDSLMSQRWAATVLAGAVVLPPCFLDQQRLAFTSTLSIVVTLYVLILVAIAAVQQSVVAPSDQHAGELCVFGVAGGGLTALCLVYYSIVMQYCVQPIYLELEDRSPEKFRRVLAVAFAVNTVLYCVMGVCGYVAFGPAVQGNVINSLPAGMATTFARGAMALCMVGVFPLQIMPVLTPFKEQAIRENEGLNQRMVSGPITESQVMRFSFSLSSMNFEPSRSDDKLVLIAAVCIVVFVTMSSLFITNLGPLVALNGAVMVSTFSGVIPGIIGLRLLDAKPLWWRAGCWTLIAGSCCCSVGGLIFTENQPDQLAAACLKTMVAR